MTPRCRRITRLALAMLISAVVGACAPAEASSESAEGPVINVELSDFRFTPALIEVPADQRFTLALRNTGKMDHDLTIDALHLKVILKPGRPARRVLEPMPGGTSYAVVCSIMGHAQLGMVGKLLAR